MSRTSQRLAQLGIVLPQPTTPLANYLPYSPVTSGGHLLFVAGQGTRRDGLFQFVGKVGAGLSLEQGYEAARICAINLLAELAGYCAGNLDRVARIHKVNGFVNAAPDFTEVPKVVNGASDLLVEVLGERGRHARTAIGVATLPAGMAVEVEAVVEIDAPRRKREGEGDVH